MDFIRLSFNEGRHHISFPASLYFKTSNDAKSIFAALILRQCSNASSKFAILSQCICLSALRMHGCLSGCAGTFKGTDWPSFHPWPYSWSPIIGAYRIKCWAHECSAAWTKELCRNFRCPRTGKVYLTIYCTGCPAHTVDRLRCIMMLLLFDTKFSLYRKWKRFCKDVEIIKIKS